VGGIWSGYFSGYSPSESFVHFFNNMGYEKKLRNWSKRGGNVCSVQTTSRGCDAG
jgi:hypothetical protein